MNEVPQSKIIMIVDDDHAIVEAITLALTDEGYCIKSVTDGKLVYGQMQPLPDLILLDLRMSGTDGSMLCKELKDEPLTRHIPIIIVSAHKDTSIIAAQVNANDYLEKPFNLADLLEKVSKHLLA